MQNIPAVSRNDNKGARLASSQAITLLTKLVERGVITAESQSRALALQAQTGIHPLPGLLRLNAAAELPLYREAASLLGLELLQARPDLDLPELSQSTDQGAQALGLSWQWLSEKGLLAFERAGRWHVAFRDEMAPDVQAMFDRKFTRLSQQHLPMLVTPSLFERVRERLDQRGAKPLASSADDVRSLRELAEEGPTIELVNSILSRAVTQRASDVHFEAEEFDFCVRMRVDGEMLELARQPRARYDAVACRIKILAELDIAERRMAQDGRINARVNGEAFDVRVSVLPAAHGESIVLRLLRQERKPTKLQDLGMMPSQAAVFDKWVRLSNGIVLVTGPTGSGKSTTLYTALELANDRSQKIITIEDPIEYKIPGLTQLQVNADIGFTFAAALRSILRHDPDVILVGEIRDAETARIAIQSALTGHLVLSTLHTNSAMGAVTRLIDMGIEPFLISASVRGLMAQRLVRRLCAQCKLPDLEPSDAVTGMFSRLGLVLDMGLGLGLGLGAPSPAGAGAASSEPTPAATGLMKPVGCTHCANTGFRGRLAVYDLIEFTTDLGHRLAAGQSEAQLLEAAGPLASSGLLHSGAQWIAAGETTLAEVLRATGAG
jgi:general secretion pathway protein E